MSDDAFSEFKNKQKEGWAHFIPVEQITCMPAAHLVEYAGVREGHTLLDIGCGTGVVALNARLRGAKVTGLDLTPELLAHAKENAQVAAVDLTLVEGDAEKLPFADASFDVVVSQFGHMFAPRPVEATREMLRVLKPGGRLAFNTWPPEHFTGQMFALIGGYGPPPPAGVSPPAQWGDPNIVRERLGSAVRELEFERGQLNFPGLSVKHLRSAFERTVGPLIKVVPLLGDAKRHAFRAEFESLIAKNLVGNALRQHYLLTRAIKN